MNSERNVKVTERGWPGHFICADSCRFRRNTLIEYGDKKWIISTVGLMIIKDPKTGKLKFETVGLDRYYETVAFVGEEVDGYIDADVDQPIDFESECAINDIEADSELRANDMHEKVVSELVLKIQE